jgi:methionyl-tRNA formyltransferase
VDPAGAPGVADAPLPPPPAHPRRLVYLGSPEMAVPPLRALHEAGFEIALVVTGADKRRGRGGATSPTPVGLEAMALGLPVSHDAREAADVGADLGVVVAFGELLRRPLLQALPMVNLHFSLLPRWRGAAPVERAILAGDERTGVCVMAVEVGLDTGGVYARSELAIRRTSTATELGAQLTEVGSRLLVDVLRGGLADPPEPQVGEATYAHKLTNEDRHLDWGRPALELHRVVRIGGAWTTFRGRRLKVLEAVVDPGEGPPEPSADAAPAPGAIEGNRVATGAGALRLVRVQPEGKGPLAASDWLRGVRPEPTERMGEAP